MNYLKESDGGMTIKICETKAKKTSLHFFFFFFFCQNCMMKMEEVDSFKFILVQQSAHAVAAFVALGSKNLLDKKKKIDKNPRRLFPRKKKKLNEFSAN